MITGLVKYKPYGWQCPRNMVEAIFLNPNIQNRDFSTNENQIGLNSWSFDSIIVRKFEEIKSVLPIF